LKVDPDMALTFLDFVEARHQVWEKRQLGEPQPWTDDPIVATRKFTNVFRVLDYGSQFVLTDLIEEGLDPKDQLMRLFLYRHTGRVEVWEFLHLMMGRYPKIGDLVDVLDLFKQYRGDAHVRTRNVDPKNPGRKTQTDFKRSVFTSAYLVFPQSQIPGTDKLESIVDLTKRLFLHGTVAQEFLAAGTQAERFQVLRQNKGVADFMSMQILTDWGYTTKFREDDFVVAGPGARKGAAHLDPTAKAEDVISWAVKAIRSSPTAPRLEGRLPSYMDVQNCLCEFSKYVRYMSKPSPEKLYAPAHPGLASFVLPANW
jgi:hypothetical protein